MKKLLFLSMTVFYLFVSAHPSFADRPYVGRDLISDDKFKEFYGYIHREDNYKILTILGKIEKDENTFLLYYKYLKVDLDITENGVATLLRLDNNYWMINFETTDFKLLTK